MPVLLTYIVFVVPGQQTDGTDKEPVDKVNLK